MNNLHSGLLYSLTGVTALASMSSCASQKKTEEQKPFNIVYIMTDENKKLRLISRSATFT